MSFLEVLDRGAGATKSRRHHAPRREDGLPRHGPPRDRRLHQLEGARGEEGARADRGRLLLATSTARPTARSAGQNSNNSVRVTDAFMKAVRERRQVADHVAHHRRGASRRYAPRELWREIAEAAWQLRRSRRAVRHHDQPTGTPARTPDRINASNPCSEYMFLDDTACNLASINLMKFLREDGVVRRRGLPPREPRLLPGAGDPGRLRVLPDREDRAELARLPPARPRLREPRHAAHGAGHPVRQRRRPRVRGGAHRDHDAARPTRCRPRWRPQGPVRRASRRTASRMLERHAHAPRRGLRDRPRRCAPRDLRAAASRTGTRAVALGEQHGYRNAQATVLAPTGTIGLLMDCDTTGIEPDFALVKFKKLAGGGYFKIVNQSVPRGAAPPRLRRRRRSQRDRRATSIGTEHARRRAARQPRDAQAARAHRRARSTAVEEALPGMFDLRFAFARGMLGDETLRAARRHAGRAREAGFNAAAVPRLHRRSRSTRPTTTICGRMTVEGAPAPRGRAPAGVRLRQPLRTKGTRFIAPMGHVRMMARGAAVPLGRDQQDREPAERRHGRGRRSRSTSSAGSSASRRSRSTATAASSQPAARRSRAKKAEAMPTRRHGGRRRPKLAPAAALPEAPPRLHAGGARRRAQGLPAHRRVRGRHARRDLHRHAQGGRRVPQHDELLRDLRLDGPAVRRAARGLRRPVHVHALRAAGPRRGARRTCELCTSVVDYMFRVLGIEYLEPHRPRAHRDRGHAGRDQARRTTPPAIRSATSTAARRTRHPPTPNSRHRTRTSPRTVETAAVAMARRPRQPKRHGRRHGRAREPCRTQGADRAGGAGDGTGRDARQVPGRRADLRQLRPHHDAQRTCYKCLNCGNSMGCS